MKESFTVTIDGPAGAGKSTIAKLVADKASLFYIDTGAMYRSVALISDESNEDPAAVAKNLTFDIIYESGEKRIIAQGRDVTLAIRTPRIDKLVSSVADNMAVRKILVNKQREIAEGRRSVLDGRDTGTVVFPDADIKFYLDASVGVRASRRLKECIEKGFETTLEALRSDIERRDNSDRAREWGALVVPDDAVVIDTSNMSIREVVEEVISYIDKNEH